MISSASPHLRVSVSPRLRVFPVRRSPAVLEGVL